MGTRPETTLDGASGFIARQSDQPVFIPDLHDILYAHFKTAFISIRSYKGRTDLHNMCNESDGELSTDCSIILPENLFKWNKTLTFIDLNQTAKDRKDYVEILINCNPITVRQLFFNIQDIPCPERLQVITINQDDVVTNNLEIARSPVDTRINTMTEKIGLVWNNGQTVKFIFRFIGCSVAGRYKIEGIFGMDSRHMLQEPLACR